MEKENRARLPGLLGIYMPEDRLWALAESRNLPERTWGAAMFADISGFTPLAENLVKEFGPRRGTEELTQQIYAVFEAIISALHR